MDDLRYDGWAVMCDTLHAVMRQGIGQLPNVRQLARGRVKTPWPLMSTTVRMAVLIWRAAMAATRDQWRGEVGDALTRIIVDTIWLQIWLSPRRGSQICYPQECRTRGGIERAGGRNPEGPEIGRCIGERVAEDSLRNLKKFQEVIVRRRETHNMLVANVRFNEVPSVLLRSLAKHGYHRPPYADTRWKEVQFPLVGPSEPSMAGLADWLRPWPDEDRAFDWILARSASRMRS